MADRGAGNKETHHGRFSGISTAIGHVRDEHARVFLGQNSTGRQPILSDLEGLHPVGPTVRKEGETGEVEGGDRVRFGVRSVEMVGVHELEKGLIVEEFGERVFWVGVGKLETSGFPCARMMEAGESADGVGNSTPWLLNDNLKRRLGCQIDWFSRKGIEITRGGRWGTEWRSR